MNRLLCLGCGMVLLAGSGGLRGEIAVVANRTIEPLVFSVQADSAEKATPYRLLPAQVCAVKIAESGELTLEGVQAPFLLEADQAYYFVQSEQDAPQLLRLGLGDLPSEPRPPSPTAAVEITLKLVVDDEEPAAESIWRKRLEARLAQAASVLQQTCGVTLRVVATDNWDSDDGVSDLPDALSELEREVDRHSARLVVAFTGQFRQPEPETRLHLGGTRGTARTHLLIREWVPGMSEPEKLEVLLHELGHFLGAVHCPDPHSVMRPELADRRARSAGFAITFDPVNALIMNLVAIEFSHGRHTPETFSPYARERIEQLRAVLATPLPDDVAAAPPSRDDPRPPATGSETTGLPMVDESGDPLVDATRQLLAVLRQRPPASLEGDALAAHFVAETAHAAQRLPAAVAPRAFILALGMGLDDSGTLRDLPVSQAFCRLVETETQRQSRIRQVGRATLKGRRDWAQHFFVSAFLTAHAGSETATAAGYVKELLDSRPGGSGFSRGDLAADQAGVRFAELILGREYRVLACIRDFSADAFWPVDAK